MHLPRALAVLVAASLASAWTTPALGRSLFRHHTPPKPPVWPSDYTVSYTFSVPYIKTYQKQGLEYPTVVYVEDGGKRLRVDIYASEDVIITTKEKDVELVPRYNQTECLIFLNDQGGGGEGPSLGSNVDGAIAVLPDITDWPYKGSMHMKGERVNLWEYEKKHQAKTTRYSFYVRDNGSPVKLHQHGNDIFTGSHFDEWLVDFTSYVPGPSTRPVFDPPKLCDGVKPGNRSVANMGFRSRMHALLPRVPLGDDNPVRHAAYDSFAAEHGRIHFSHQEYAFRLGVYLSNVQFIDQWNQDNLGAALNGRRRHTLAVNKFADWTEEEFMAIMLPNHGKNLPRPEHPQEVLHQAVTPAERIPTTVSWKSTGADGPVKDQSACGSCWAFGAVGAVQAAYFMETGEARLFSEQQLMDCSWGHTHNKACDGGLYEGAFHYLMGAGKHGNDSGHNLALEDDYPYRGADSFCLDRTKAVTHKSPVRVKGFRAIKRGDAQGVKEALYTKGPLAVSIDAAQPTFRFYSSGVYNDPSCKYKQNELDHSVMLVGYGTTDSEYGSSSVGEDYWEIKNEWSAFWGDGGYIRISRDHHGCGIVSDAVYALVEPTESHHSKHDKHSQKLQRAEPWTMEA